VGVSRDCPFFRVPHNISTTGKTTKFQFCMNIYRLNRNKSPLKFFRSSRGRTQGLPKIFRASIHSAHRAVIFAIAQLSCFRCVLWQTIHKFTTAKVSEGTNRNMPARNTLVQLLALYTDPESHNAQRCRQTDGRTTRFCQ